MLQVLPTKTKGSAFAVFSDEVLYAYSKIVVIYQVASQDHFIKSLHQNTKSCNNHFSLSRNWSTTYQPFSFQPLRPWFILLVAFTVQNGYTFCPHNKDSSVDGQLWHFLYVLLKNFPTKVSHNRVGWHASLNEHAGIASYQFTGVAFALVLSLEPHYLDPISLPAFWEIALD